MCGAADGGHRTDHGWQGEPGSNRGPGRLRFAYINQPVIQYGYNGTFGGNFWGMASWHCGSGDNTCLHSPLDTVFAGDSISGYVSTLLDCPHSPCHWYVEVYDLTRDTWTGIDYKDSLADTLDYSEAVGGAVEVKNLTSCSQFPVTGVFLNSISLLDAYGNKQSPVNWQKQIDSILPPVCSFGVTFTDSTVNLYHNPLPPPQISVTIYGPNLVPAHHSCTWTAAASGGTEPYSYQWEVNGSAAGDGSDTLTITTPGSNFTISVTATDANQLSGGTSVNVRVGGGSCEQ